MASGKVHAVIVMTPQPGKLAELEKICLDSIPHHQSIPNCLSLHVTKTVDVANFEKGWTESAVDGEIAIFQEWASLDAMLENGKSEWAEKARTEAGPILAGPPVTKVARGMASIKR